MNRKLTAILLILAAVLANVGFTALGSIFNYPDVLDEPAGKVLASFRDHAERRQRLVRRAGGLGRAARTGRDRRRQALDGAGDAHRGAGRDHCRGRSRSSACCAGRSSSPATRPTPRAATPSVASCGPRLVHDRERHPRHRGRRDARLPPHRDVDRARGRRARAPLRRSLVPGARHRVGARSSSSASSRRSTSPASTPRTSSATCCGACGSIAFGVVILVHERRDAHDDVAAMAAA